ncbi:hypothetical protein MVES1_003823 [Malassezia vespertilionis]|uniref:uncharacterized protein n=1 Tax=Malassezia vespertilionis TaxID=2020962 RepID=UPI0024B05D11|nr:uncharacterized protein MVES1_003823 [Malassezia vespertilionis]WFD08447.1 hypothetical protein MVES1_003823 [Malassezia vespertilionis]
MAPIRALFGNAVTMALEGNFMDASELRQVPDNQEVLLGQDSNVSVILEVLQQVEPGTSPDDMDRAVRYHFDSIANDNDATDVHVTWVDVAAGDAPAGKTPQPALLQGTQRVKKFGKPADNDLVHIWVAVWRLPSKKVDLALSLNEPSDADTDAIAQRFRASAGSLRIVNWDLFA